MHWTPIKKTPESWQLPPNLLDYEKTCASFSWQTISQELTGLHDSQELNMAYLAVDRHANGPIANQLALRWLGGDGSTLDFTYSDLQEQTNRFANLLRHLDVGKGDTVFVFTDRIPALYFAALGTLKNNSIFCPLFSAFGPESIFHRLQRGDAKVLVTTTRLYRQKVEGLRERLPKLQHIFLADAPEDLQEGLWSLPQQMANASPSFTPPPTDPEDIALLHFTSGTTGMPKGALHAHKAVLTHYITGKYVLDFHPGDIFWCTADPGWVTGISYGIIAPLVCGVTNIIDWEEFDAQRWYHILESEKVTIWYTSPTAIR